MMLRHGLSTKLEARGSLMVGVAMPDKFSPHRPRLFTLAYRMLGTVTDAEDVLQEAHLRFAEHAAHVQHPKRWL